MPTDNFWSEYWSLAPSEFVDATTKFLTERFAPEIRREACERVIRAALALVETGDPEDKPTLLSLKDFMAEVSDPPPAIIEQFLPAKKLICLAGAPKQGKSLVALEFLHCVATGRKLMGKYDIDQPGPVAYFGLEDGGHEIKSRLIERGVEEIEDFYICYKPFDMSSPLGWRTFIDLVESMPSAPNLVIIDTAREAFCGMRDWNDASLVGPAISPLRRWAHKNCSVILVTHTNKNKFATGVDKVSGSGALTSSCDSFMILENQSVQPNGDLRWDWEMSGRSMKRMKCVIEMDTKNLHMKAIDGEELKAVKQQEKFLQRDSYKKKIAQLIHAIKHVAIKQLASELGESYEFVSSLVKEMCADRDLIKTDETIKLEGPGRPAPLYALTEQGVNNILFGFTGLGKEDLINIIDGDSAPSSSGVNRFFDEEEKSESEICIYCETNIATLPKTATKGSRTVCQSCYDERRKPAEIEGE